MTVVSAILVRLHASPSSGRWIIQTRPSSAGLWSPDLARMEPRLNFSRPADLAQARAAFRAATHGEFLDHCDLTGRTAPPQQHTARPSRTNLYGHLGDTDA